MKNKYYMTYVDYFSALEKIHFNFVKNEIKRMLVTTKGKKIKVPKKVGKINKK